MIKILKNPLTSNYINLKKHILSKDFPWRYKTSTDPNLTNHKGHDNIEYYGYTFLSRPETFGYTEPRSDILNSNLTVLREILYDNQFFENYFFLRSAVNCVHPKEGIQLSQPHVDHNFPHYNLLVYLTNTDGETFVEDETHLPKEDDIIIFTGNHYMKRPSKGRRIELISTIFPFDNKGLSNLGIPHSNVSY